MVGRAGAGAALVQRAGHERSTTRTRRSTSGSRAGRSTPPTTAWTATSRPGSATASRSTGAARRARSATSPTPSCYADVQRFANALKDRGVEQGDVVGIYLPMIPEVVVAMLACARIGAPHNVVFGGFSRRVGQGAHGVLRRQGADHRRRRAAQGQGRRRSRQPVDEVGHAGRRRRSSSATPAIDVPDGRRRRLVRRDRGGGRRRVRRPARSTPSTRCSSSTRRGSTAKPKGILHTTGGYLTSVAWTHKHVFDLKPESDVYWCSGRRRLDHRPHLHRLRAADQRRDVGDVRGRARLPAQGHLVGALRALRRRRSSTPRRRRSARA